MPRQKTYYQDNTNTLYLGDNRSVLGVLPEESVQCCVTSPPYWGLRDYGTAEWEGGVAGCDHQAPPKGGGTKGAKLAGTSNRDGYSGDGQYHQDCRKCGARRIDTQLGLEETPEKYVDNLVEVFRGVHRVLRGDGTLWLNLGDSYATGGHGGHQQPDKGGNPSSFHGHRPRQLDRIPKHKPPPGLKPKDLVGIPWRVAFALQADGWYLRQDIIWHKTNPMPESVTDRCTKAHEYLFLLSKSARYYYDAEAIAEAAMQPIGKSKQTGQIKSVILGQKTGTLGTNQGGDARNKRSVWTVPTHPYKGAHFAVFPPELIHPCILAGCPKGGTVLDPFSGAGTTPWLAKTLGRKGIGIELNEEYCKLALQRITKGVRKDQVEQGYDNVEDHEPGFGF